MNASTLSDPNSLHIPLTSPHISDNSIPFPALIDSGSSHCFIDSKFASQYLLSLTSILPIKLKLIDGTISNSITNQSLELSVKFPFEKCMTISPFVFLLNPFTPLALGYNWLTHYNLLIDWVLGSTIFHPQLLEKLNLPLTRSAQLPLHQPPYSDTPPSSAPTLTVSIINLAAFLCACKLPRAHFVATGSTRSTVGTRSWHAR